MIDKQLHVVTLVHQTEVKVNSCSQFVLTDISNLLLLLILF